MKKERSLLLSDETKQFIRERVARWMKLFGALDPKSEIDRSFVQQLRSMAHQDDGYNFLEKYAPRSDNLKENE